MAKEPSVSPARRAVEGDVYEKGISRRPPPAAVKPSPPPAPPKPKRNDTRSER